MTDATRTALPDAAGPILFPRGDVPSPLVLTRRGLLSGTVLAIVGSAFGILFGIPHGIVADFEAWLVGSCLIFSIGLFITLTITPLARLSPVAIAATSYFALYLSAGAVDALPVAGGLERLLQGYHQPATGVGRAARE
jgi:hypothetical protein